MDFNSECEDGSSFLNNTKANEPKASSINDCYATSIPNFHTFPIEKATINYDTSFSSDLNNLKINSNLMDILRNNQPPPLHINEKNSYHKDSINLRNMLLSPPTTADPSHIPNIAGMPFFSYLLRSPSILSPFMFSNASEFRTVYFDKRDLISPSHEVPTDQVNSLMSSTSPAQHSPCISHRSVIFRMQSPPVIASDFVASSTPPDSTPFLNFNIFDNFCHLPSSHSQSGPNENLCRHHHQTEHLDDVVNSKIISGQYSSLPLRIKNYNEKWPRVTSIENNNLPQDNTCHLILKRKTEPDINICTHIQSSAPLQSFEEEELMKEAMNEEHHEYLILSSSSCSQGTENQGLNPILQPQSSNFNEITQQETDQSSLSDSDSEDTSSRKMKILSDFVQTQLQLIDYTESESIDPKIKNAVHDVIPLEIGDKECDVVISPSVLPINHDKYFDANEFNELNVLYQYFIKAFESDALQRCGVRRSFSCPVISVLRLHPENVFKSDPVVSGPFGQNDQFLLSNSSNKEPVNLEASAQIIFNLPSNQIDGTPDHPIVGTKMLYEVNTDSLQDHTNCYYNNNNNNNYNNNNQKDNYYNDFFNADLINNFHNDFFNVDLIRNQVYVSSDEEFISKMDPIPFLNENINSTINFSNSNSNSINNNIIKHNKKKITNNDHDSNYYDIVKPLDSFPINTCSIPNSFDRQQQSLQASSSSNTSDDASPNAFAQIQERSRYSHRNSFSSTSSNVSNNSPSNNQMTSSSSSSFPVLSKMSSALRPPSCILRGFGQVQPCDLRCCDQLQIRNDTQEVLSSSSFTHSPPPFTIKNINNYNQILFNNNNNNNIKNLGDENDFRTPPNFRHLYPPAANFLSAPKSQKQGTPFYFCRSPPADSCFLTPESPPLTSPARFNPPTAMRSCSDTKVVSPIPSKDLCEQQMLYLSCFKPGLLGRRSNSALSRSSVGVSVLNFPQMHQILSSFPQKSNPSPLNQRRLSCTPSVTSRDDHWCDGAPRSLLVACNHRVSFLAPPSVPPPDISLRSPEAVPNPYPDDSLFPVEDIQFSLLTNSHLAASGESF